MSWKMNKNRGTTITLLNFVHLLKLAWTIRKQVEKVPRKSSALGSLYLPSFPP